MLLLLYIVLYVRTTAILYYITIATTTATTTILVLLLLSLLAWLVQVAVVYLINCYCCKMASSSARSMSAWERQVLMFSPSAAPDSDTDEEQTLDENNIDPEDALSECFNMLVDLKMSGKLSAIQVCTLCWWLSKAGLKAMSLIVKSFPI